MKFNFLEVLKFTHNEENIKTFFIQHISSQHCIVAHIKNNEVMEKVIRDDELQRVPEQISNHDKERILKYFKGIDFKFQQKEK